MGHPKFSCVQIIKMHQSDRLQGHTLARLSRDLARFSKAKWFICMEILGWAGMAVDVQRNWLENFVHLDKGRI